MAPEFFLFIAFVGLAVLAVGGLIATVVLLVWAHYSARLRRVLRVLSAVVFAGVVVVGLILLWLGASIRQQYFLNEPFVSACGQGDLVEAQRLLSCGASPDAYGVDFFETALIAASRNGRVEIVALLLRSGANTDLQDSDGKTALQRAREADQKEIISMLEHAGGKT
jgi:hypothetical protein